jgi:hypothetical protein
MRCKPGITGWAQLKYAYGASVKDAEEKLKFDLYYVKNHSFMFDLLTLLQTVEVVVFRQRRTLMLGRRVNASPAARQRCLPISGSRWELTLNRPAAVPSGSCTSQPHVDVRSGHVTARTPRCRPHAGSALPARDWTSAAVSPIRITRSGARGERV